jgi:hypothetical protein
MIRKGALQRFNDDALGFAIHGGDQIDCAFKGNFFGSLPTVENERSRFAGRIPGDADKFFCIRLHHTDFRKFDRRMLAKGA